MTRTQLCALWCVLLAAILAPVPWVAAQTRAPLTIDPADVRGSISPNMFAANVSADSIVPPDLWPDAERLGLNLLRFPAGQWADQNDLTRSQLDLFMLFAEQMGADVLMQVRLRGGTPEQAADWVTYMNLVSGYNVRYWSIGNEPSLYPEYDTRRANREWRAIAEAMLAVDPTITLVGPDVHQFNGTLAVDPRDRRNRDWLRSFLRDNGDLLGVVSVHRYPFPQRMTAPNISPATLYGNTAEWTALPIRARAAAREYARRVLPVAVTEANSHWARNIGGPATPDSVPNAVWWADALGRMIAADTAMAIVWEIKSSDARGGWGLLSERGLRPTGCLYTMLADYGDERLAVARNNRRLSVYPARSSADGTITLMVVNASEEPSTQQVRVDGYDAEAVVQARRVDPDHCGDALDDFTLSDAEWPAHSVTVVTLAGE